VPVLAAIPLVASLIRLEEPSGTVEPQPG
jgi:hypothetical protein